MTNYIEQNSAEAHLRRRDTVMYTNGLNLENIQKHMSDTINAKVSTDTIHKMMHPPRRGTIGGRRYKCLVPARVPPKRNSKEKKTHPDFHYTFAQVNILNEMAALNGTIQLSVDNKNKVDVGINACSRRNKIRSFHLTNAAPNYVDHDFPVGSKTKLVPAGYMRLKSKHLVGRTRSLSPPSRSKSTRRSRRHSTSSTTQPKRDVTLTKDKSGRDKVQWSRSGPLTIQIHSTRTIETTNVMHVNFLISYLLNIKKSENVFNVTAIADGGPDWSTKGLGNLISLGIMWEQLQLDTLVVQCFAPGHSRFNPIERLWSHLTKLLTTVVLPADIAGVVPKENDVEGWNAVLDQATDLCSRFWNGKKYDGFPIRTFLFLSDNPKVKQIKLTHDLIYDFVNTSKTELKKNTTFQLLRDKYLFLVKHTNRKKFQLEFIRCQDSTCPHCSKLPVRDNKFLDAIRAFGGSVPTPVIDISGKHYRTFLDLSQSPFIYQNTKMNNEEETCPFCKNYAIFSDADRKRHFTLMGH